MNGRTKGALEIKQMRPSDYASWDAYIDRVPQGTFFHRSGWKRVIESSFGHRCYYLQAIRNGIIEGVLPLVHIDSRIFGKALISTGFCVYGGPIADNQDAMAGLNQAAVTVARQLRVDYLEYRQRSGREMDWPCNDVTYATFRRSLDADNERNFMAIPRKRRAVIRKALASNLECEVEKDVERFFRVYTESVRNLGTPVFAIDYFRYLLETFQSCSEILTVSYRGEPLSSVFSFYFRDEVLPYYGGGTRRARQFGANDLMYWELMRRSVYRGYRIFDFGRSKRGTGAFYYKKNWGFMPSSLYYEYYLPYNGNIPSVNPLNPKYRPFIALWRHLPLWLANRIGPMVARNLG